MPYWLGSSETRETRLIDGLGPLLGRNWGLGVPSGISEAEVYTSL